jgi:flagellar motor switch protein FliM
LNRAEQIPKQNEIVLVKMKSLSWPAIVQQRQGDVLEVKMIFDEKVRIVSVGDVEKFAVEKIVNTKNLRLKTAFAKAVELLKK